MRGRSKNKAILKRRSCVILSYSLSWEPNRCEGPFFFLWRTCSSWFIHRNCPLLSPPKTPPPPTSSDSSRRCNDHHHHLLPHLSFPQSPQSHLYYSSLKRVASCASVTPTKTSLPRKQPRGYSPETDECVRAVAATSIMRLICVVCVAQTSISDEMREWNSYSS